MHSNSFWKPENFVNHSSEKCPNGLFRQFMGEPAGSELLKALLWLRHIHIWEYDQNLVGWERRTIATEISFQRKKSEWPSPKVRSTKDRKSQSRAIWQLSLFWKSSRWSFDWNYYNGWNYSFWKLLTKNKILAFERNPPIKLASQSLYFMWKKWCKISNTLSVKIELI